MRRELDFGPAFRTQVRSQAPKVTAKDVGRFRPAPRVSYVIGDSAVQGGQQLRRTAGELAVPCDGSGP